MSHRTVARVLLLLALGVGVAACGGNAGDAAEEAVPTAVATPIVVVDEPTAPAAPTPNEADGDAANATPDASDPLVTEPTPAFSIAPCEEVPTFFAADTVSVACVDGFAVSPELFANNAGWHVYDGRGGPWSEIDYALTCCGDDQEASFVELLERNFLSPAQVDVLCAASGLAEDPFSGCDDAAPDRAELADAGWLRVNGLGDFDFGTSDSTVQQAVADVFGPALNQVELGECGAGPMTAVTWDDFTLNFQAGEFIGWFYTASTPALTSPSGVAPGISESDLLVAYDGVGIFTDTLGKEFSFQVPAGFMGGFFDDAGTSVTSMFAGSQCFFR